MTMLSIQRLTMSILYLMIWNGFDCQHVLSQLSEDISTPKEAVSSLQDSNIESQNQAIAYLSKFDYLINGFPKTRCNDKSTELQRLEHDLGNDASIMELCGLFTSKRPEVVDTALMTIAVLREHAQKARDPVEYVIADTSLPAETRFMAIITMMHIAPRDESIVKFILPHDFLLNHQHGKPCGDGKRVFGIDKEDYEKIEFAIFAFAPHFLETDRTTNEIPYLLEHARCNESIIARSVCIGLIGKFSQDAETAIEDLCEMAMCDCEKVIRVMSVYSLAQITMDVSFVEEILNNVDLSRPEKVEVMKKVNAHIGEYEEYIKDLKQDKTLIDGVVTDIKCMVGFYRRELIRDLGKVGPAAINSENVLREILKNCDDETQCQILRSIRLIRSSYRSAQ